MQYSTFPLWKINKFWCINTHICLDSVRQYWYDEMVLFTSYEALWSLTARNGILFLPDTKQTVAHQGIVQIMLFDTWIHSLKYCTTKSLHTLHPPNNILLTKLFPNSDVSRVMPAQIMDTILLLYAKSPSLPCQVCIRVLWNWKESDYHTNSSESFLCALLVMCH